MFLTSRNFSLKFKIGFFKPGVHVTAITISKEQVNHAKTIDLETDELAFLRVPGLGSAGEGSFEFRLQDYRDVEETFDRIVSVGMFEHVGPKCVFRKFNLPL